MYTETIFLETIHTYITCIYWMVKEYTCPHFPGWKTDIKEDDVKYRFSITIIMSLLLFFAWECFASFFDVVHIEMMDLSKKIDRPLKFNMEPDMMFAKKASTIPVANFQVFYSHLRKKRLK